MGRVNQYAIKTAARIDPAATTRPSASVRLAWELIGAMKTSRGWTKATVHGWRLRRVAATW